MARRRRGHARAIAQAAKLGREVRLARSIAGLSVARAARLGGVSASTWQRIERGSSGVSLHTACAATSSVGLDLVVTAYPGAGPGLRDTGQMVLAAELARMAAPSWRSELEVPAGSHGEAIDQVFWGPGEIIAVEIERLIADGQAQLRRAALKRDHLASLHRRPVRLVLVIEDTRRNRAALAPHLPLLRSPMPAGSRAFFGALRSGTALGSDGLAWIRRPRRGA